METSPSLTSTDHSSDEYTLALLDRIKELCSIDFVASLIDPPPERLPFFFLGSDTCIPLSKKDSLIVNCIDVKDFDTVNIPESIPPLIWVGSDIFEDVEYYHDLSQLNLPSFCLPDIVKCFHHVGDTTICITHTFIVNHWLPASNSALPLVFDYLSSPDQDLSRWIESNSTHFRFWLDYILAHYPETEGSIEVLCNTFL